MTESKRFRILLLFVILTLLLLAMPAVPAQAASITVAPTIGPAGTTVAVAGTAFTAGHTIDIYFSSSWISYVTASVIGGISTTFTVPSVSAGAYQVRAFDFDTGLWLATVAFTVTATGAAAVAAAEITIRPEKGPVGTEVEIDGSGFDSREDIIVEYDGEVVDIQSGDYRADASGEFENTIIVIPESTAGDHTIIVSGDDSGNEAEAEFTVEPQVTISPISGQSGTEVTVTGAGFAYRSDVNIYFNNNKVTEKKADRDGSFTATFKAPASKAGSYDVEAEDAENNADAVDFTVLASMSINLTSGKVGAELTVTGGGFSGAVTIKYDNAVAVTATADASGAFSAAFNVPLSMRGDHVVTASDGTSEKSATFAVIPDVSLAPASGNVGTRLTVTGSGFSGAVTIKYDDAKITTSTADASGAFSIAFPAPASTMGEHIITASDNATTLQVTFVMESEAPPAPVLLLPAAGSKAKAPIHFDWEDVTDPSGVTYIFQLASDANFTIMVREVEGLTTSEYAVAEDKELPATKKEAPYYWRIKAVDGASNEGEWSMKGTFYIGFSFALPDWAKYTLIGLGVLLVCLFGFWLGKRYAYS